MLYFSKLAIQFYIFLCIFLCILCTVLQSCNNLNDTINMFLVSPESNVQCTMQMYEKRVSCVAVLSRLGFRVSDMCSY